MSCNTTYFIKKYFTMLFLLLKTVFKENNRFYKKK